MDVIESKQQGGASMTDGITIQRVDLDPGHAWSDLMGGAARLDVAIHDHGLCSLIDVMPRLVPEGHTGAGTKKVNEDRGLIRYLLRHRHTTPFEMVEFKFHVRMPIFVARQWIRHRTANVNEYSARYSIVPDRFYRPTRDDIRQQSKSNRQGRDEPINDATADAFLKYLERAEALHEDYLKLTEQGLAREIARIGLPQSVYTEWYWKIDLHNLLRFLSLRIDEHAQKEIRDFARAMLALIEPMCPWTVEAWRDYELESVRLTRLEIEAIRAGKAQLETENKREQAEWDAKRSNLGLD